MKQLLNLIAPKKKPEPEKPQLRIRSTVTPAETLSFNEVFSNIHKTSLEVYKINRTVNTN